MKCEVCRFFGSFPPFTVSLLHSYLVFLSEAGAGRKPVTVGVSSLDLNKPASLASDSRQLWSDKTGSKRICGIFCIHLDK